MSVSRQTRLHVEPHPRHRGRNSWTWSTSVLVSRLVTVAWMSARRSMVGHHHAGASQEVLRSHGLGLRCLWFCLFRVVLGTRGHVDWPVGLLTRIVTIGCVPTTVENCFFATVGAPLLLLRLGYCFLFVNLCLLPTVCNGSLLVLLHRGSHLHHDEVGIVLDLSHLLLVPPLHLLQLQLQALDGGLRASLL